MMYMRDYTCTCATSGGLAGHHAYQLGHRKSFYTTYIHVHVLHKIVPFYQHHTGKIVHIHQRCPSTTCIIIAGFRPR